jgi:soluble lytic murein transglycosylase
MLNRLAARELDALARALESDGEREPFLLEAYRQVDAPARALRLALRFGERGELPPETLAAYLYPRAYWSVVSTAAGAERIDPYLVLAVMRQESRFDPDAVSPAAAHGLMQLIVSTANRVAGPPVTARDLHDPARNIDLGTRELARLMYHHRGDVARAIAAYNAGEDAMSKWEARFPDAPDDEFVEDITFRETRSYVKTVIGNYRRYRRLYGTAGEVRALGTEWATLDSESLGPPLSAAIIAPGLLSAPTLPLPPRS